MTDKKVFEVIIDITSTAWESATAMVEAESEEEARELFEADPYGYDWEDWETHDSETRHWEIESVEYDKWATASLREREKTKENIDDNQ
tara:strand:- start:158 stop:424 length:267 start_codon:yes stop_codon:yes gene_type:complete